MESPQPALVQFWLQSWEHECCGDHRKVGQTITVDLSFDGQVEATDQPDLVEPLRDGLMVLVGPARDAKRFQPGWVVSAGPVEFAYRGKSVADRVRCSGKLWEERHDDGAAGEVTGRITSIEWRPVVYEKGSDGEYSSSGYGEPAIIYNTDNYPGRPKPMSQQLAKVLSDPERYGAVIKPAPIQPPPSSWAFVFTLEV